MARETGLTYAAAVWNERVRPGTFVVAKQTSLFEQGLTAGRTIDVALPFLRQARALVSPEELRGRYDPEAMESLIRVRHLLLRWPPQATDSQRDSIRSAATELRRRAVGGEDFGALAAAYSQDPTSNTQRGDLGYVRLSQLVGPLQALAAALDRRIARAAQQVCGDPWTAELAMARMARNCRAEAIASARAGTAMARQGFAGTSAASGSK